MSAPSRGNKLTPMLTVVSSDRPLSSMALFLASPAGRYVAGTSIVIDRGYTAV
jgi:hypothetical protein